MTTGLSIHVSDEALDRLADLVADRVSLRLAHAQSAADDRWLTTKEAAGYLGLSVAALHRLTGARQIPFEQSSPNARCWFRRSTLDSWRQGGGG